jgi:hypothetical protein
VNFPSTVRDSQKLKYPKGDILETKKLWETEKWNSWRKPRSYS